MNKELTAFITKKLPVFFTTNIGILVLGFILTTVCGGIINALHTQATWKRDKGFELFKSQLTKHDELLTDLSKTTGARVYRVQRVLWNFDQPTSETPAETWCLDARAKAEIETRWTEYDKAVVDWNLTYRDIRGEFNCSPEMISPMNFLRQARAGR